jgi:hypothetical protein
MAAAAVCESSEGWHVLSETEMWKLSVADGVTRRSGDTVFTRYLLEHPVAHENQRTGRRFRGTVINVTINCRTRTYVIGDLASYAESGARGKPVDRFTVPEAEKRSESIVAGSTFDILRKYVCER